MSAVFGAVLVQFPWWLVLAGALRKLFVMPRRLQRMQAEGAAILAAGMLMRWAAWGRDFDMDPERAASFAFWMARGEEGLFFIGAILFAVGYFLERRPLPGLTPWPRAGKTAAVAAILVSGGAGLLLLGRGTFFGMTFPWEPARVMWSLGAYPFAAGYLAEALRRAPLELRLTANNDIEIQV